MLLIALVLLPVAWSRLLPYIMLPGTPTNKELCKSGYFQNTAAPYDDNCCSYHQCFEHFRGLQAYKRYCMAPLVWNPEICACDYQANVPGCTPAPGDWGDVEGPPFCNLTDNPENNMCCQGATNDMSFQMPHNVSQDGYKFTREEGPLGERGALYRWCVDRDLQECPGGGDFDLETCCCADVPCICECYSLHFNKVDSDDDTTCPLSSSTKCKTPKLNETAGVVGQDGTEDDRYLKCDANDNGVSMPLFQKGYFGKKFTFATFFRCDEATGNCGKGIIFNNGDEKNSYTIMAVIDAPNNVKVELLGTRDARLTLDLNFENPGRWNYLVITGEFNYGTYEMDIVVTLGSGNPSPIGGPPTIDPTPVIAAGTLESAGLFGSRCPFQYCDLTGCCDDLAVCHFAWTQGEIEAWTIDAHHLPSNPH